MDSHAAGKAPVKETKKKEGEDEFAPSEYSSQLTEKELAVIWEKYQIPPEFELETPRREDRICFPPPGRLGFYEESFNAGLRLPLHPFIKGLFLFQGISPAAVTPNSWRFICGFIVACCLAKVKPTFNLFLRFFYFKVSQGWWYVAPRLSRQTGEAPLIQGVPSSIHGWKERFFFVSFASGDDWEFCPWGTQGKTSFPSSALTKEEHKSFLILRDFELPRMKELLSAENLFSSGISRVDPKGR